MKASELIKRLQDLVDEHGDLEAFTQEYRNSTNTYELFPIESARDIYDEKKHIIFVE